MRAVAEKPHDVVVIFDTHRNLQRHRAVLPAIARLLFSYLLNFVSFFQVLSVPPSFYRSSYKLVFSLSPLFHSLLLSYFSFSSFCTYLYLGLYALK